VNVAQIAGSGGGGGGGGGGGATLWSGTRADAALFLEVSTVTAPAAAPIFNASLRLIPLLRGLDFLDRFLVDSPIRSSFSSVVQKRMSRIGSRVYTCSECESKQKGENFLRFRFLENGQSDFATGFKNTPQIFGATSIWESESLSYVSKR
jgi:hypothetical protein